jgi:uncharacterized membrane protein YkoI
MFRHTKIAAISVVLASVAVMGFAATNAMENDAVSTAAAMSKAKISLTQAITAAEQHASGKASRAEYEQIKTGWAYDVEVVAGTKVFDVRVDADKGTIISSIEDKNDRDDEHDKKD